MKNHYLKNLTFLLLLVFTNVAINAQNFTNYNPSDGLIEGGIYSIIEDQNNVLWFGSWTNPEGTGGLGSFDGTTFNQYSTDDGLAGNNVTVVFEDSVNNLWIGTTSGVSKFDGSVITNYTIDNGLVFNNVWDILEDTVGNMWFSTHQGVSMFDGTTWTNYTLEDYPVLSYVNDIMMDANGHIWFGSAGGGGVSKFDGTTWTNYTSENSGLVANDVFVVYQDTDNNYWFGTYYGAGVSKFDGTTWTTYTTADGLSNNKVRVITQDSFGDLWFGTNAGLSNFNGTTWTTYTTADGLIPGGVRAITQDNNDDLWIGTWSAGVSKFEISKVYIPDANFEQSLIDLGIDSDGIINQQILRTDALAVTDLNLTNPLFQNDGFENPLITTVTGKISDLTGIEAFINLTSLQLGNGELTSVDISKNIKLDNLFFNDNQLTGIDVSENTLLTRFGVMRNPDIATLDVSKNPLLEELFIDGTAMTNIDVSMNTNLWKFYGRWGNLSGIDLSRNTNLIDVRVRGSENLTYMNVKNGNNNKVTGFDVRDMPGLSCITADGTTVGTTESDVSQLMFDFSGGILSTDCGTVYIPDSNFEQALIDLGIDVAGIQDHIILESEALNTSSLNLDFPLTNVLLPNVNAVIQDLTGIEAFQNLISIACGGNNLPNLDFNSNTILRGVYASESSIQSINVLNNPDLTQLHLYNNQIESVDLSNNLLLEELIVQSNQITELDLSIHPNLRMAFCGTNQLTSLNIANGNNANFTPPDWDNISFGAEGNPDLACIQVDASILFNIPSHWQKDEAPVYSEDCSGPQTSWGIAGSATPNGWGGPDVVLNETENKIYEAIVELTDGLIKFRRNNNWGENYGDELNDGTLESGGPDIAVSAGKYEIVMNLNDFTYSITPYIPTLGIVGSATPNSWDGPDIEMEYNVTSSLYTGNVTLTDGLIKFREDNDWSVNYGDDGADGTLEQNGANIEVAAGYYFITVDTNALTYSLQSALVSIPDPNFEQSLIDIGIDSDGVVNASILRSDAEAVTELNIGNPLFVSDSRRSNPLIINVTEKITNLTGIESFINLTSLAGWSNALTNIDVTQNILLERLEIVGNQLTDIDVTQNTELTILWLENNQLSTVDVSQNIKLLNLAVGINPLIEIDVTSNVNLWALTTEVTQISEIDLSKNINLQQLWIADNPNLTKIDLSKNPLLFNLGIYNTSITTLDLSNNNITRLYAYNIPSLEHLDMRNGNNLNVTLLYLGDTPKLNCVNVDEAISQAMIDERDYQSKTFSEDCGDFVYIPDLNFEQALIDFGIDSDGVVNQSILTSDAEGVTGRLDICCREIQDLTGIEAFVNITELQAGANLLTEIDVSQNTELLKIWLYRNQLSELDLSNNLKLERLSAGGNELTSLDVTMLPDLHTILVWENQLTSLDVSNNLNLDLMQMQDNLIATLDISANQLLTHLSAQNNSNLILTTDTTVGNQTLTLLNLSSTGLTGNFDPILFPNLENLSLNDNEITKVVTNSIPSIKYLFINNNNLSSLKFINNPLLEQLQASNNVLTELDVRNGNNLALQTLSVTGNLLTCINVDDPLNSSMPYASWNIDFGVVLSANCKAEPEIVLIPDPIFEQKLIDEGIDLDGIGLNGSMLLSDALATTQLDVYLSGITDMTGIEAFENLETLNASFNNFNEIDLANCTNLVNIDLSFNNLTTLNVTSGRVLTQLNVGGNNLNSLNLDALTSLTNVDLSFNDFESIDASGLSQLLVFSIHNNNLSTLDMRNGNNAAMVNFTAENNSNLACIGVDDPASISNTIWKINGATVFSSNSDCVAPTVVTKDVTIFLDNKGKATAVASQFDNGSTDNITANANLIFSLNKTDFNCSNFGSNVVELSVTDEAGNVGIGYANVIVNDAIPPIARAVREYAFDLAGGNTTLNASILNNGSTDNCSIASYNLSQSYFTLPGTYYVDFIARDIGGNEGRTQVKLTVSDSDNSEILTVGNVTVTVYPNPFQDYISLKFSKNMDFSTVNVSLTDFNGNSTGAVFAVQDAKNLKATGLSGLAPGSYILTVSKGRKSDTAIMIKN
jgi:Leucine-rich repeat (LRR) protein